MEEVIGPVQIHHNRETYNENQVSSFKNLRKLISQKLIKGIQFKLIKSLKQEQDKVI